jgi:heme-degrading monooxygenase HmoA
MAVPGNACFVKGMRLEPALIPQTDAEAHVHKAKASESGSLQSRMPTPLKIRGHAGNPNEPTVKDAAYRPRPRAGDEGGIEMFARILEMKTKRGQARALCTTVEKKALPIVSKYSGFVDLLCLISEESPDSVLAMSYWQSKEAAEKYRTESYAAVAAMYQPFLEGGITVRGYEVPVALAYKGRAAKA